ncbi:MAG: C40 family peptidase [Candidatus Fibromonas sp.]|nr:C40 family peptidase [Candidatus Fibromonas sp.]
MIILILSLLLISCAPLRPLSPDSPKGYVRYMPNAPTQKKYEQNSGSITGIDAWDRVLLPWLGTPYKSGGNTKSGADCSGFVSSVYLEKEGVYMPRTTAEEFKIGTPIDKKDLAIGDLVFFGEYTRINHVGIYVGKGNFIHASTSNGVMVSPLEDIYWKPRYVGARRYL